MIVRHRALEAPLMILRTVAGASTKTKTARRGSSSSLVAVAAARSRAATTSNDAMTRRTLGHNGVFVRSEKINFPNAPAKAAAAARTLPRHDATNNGNIVVAAGCHKQNIHESNRTYSYYTRQPPPLCTDTENPSTAPLSEVLRTLVRRRKEPIPLRAAGAVPAPEPPPAPEEESATSPAATNTAVEENRRLAELADELVEGYAGLPPLRGFGDHDEDSSSCERGKILEFLATECRPSEAEVRAAAKGCAKQRDDVSFDPGTVEKLRDAATPAYEGLMHFVLRQNAVTGMGFLVVLREDLLLSIRYQTQQQQRQHANESSWVTKTRNQQFRDLDASLRSTLSRWFAPGLLVHERITYESTPAGIIEAIATREAVHPMRSLDDLKDRLGDSKRVFALFHPCLPRRPLVFVHVALLSSGLPSSMEDIRASSKNRQPQSQQRIRDAPRVAAFYSISNGVKGLAGVGLGEYLLKESIKALREELPSLETFVTLSPIPNFRKWIEVAVLREEQKQKRWLQMGAKEDGDSEGSSSSSMPLLSRKDRETLHRCGMVSSASPFPWKEFRDVLEGTDFSTWIKQAEQTTKQDVHTPLLRSKDVGDNAGDNTIQGDLGCEREFPVLRAVLLRLAASYLAVQKRRGKPLDRVCGFHVGNGAELHRLCFGADPSRGGMRRSYGLMANYLYDPARVASNQANFESLGFVVPVSPSVRAWLE